MIDESKRIVINRDNDLISLFSPAPKADLEKVLGPLSQEAYENHIKERLGMTEAPLVIDAADVPSDRLYRDAWVLRDGKIVEEFSKAAEIQKDKWRERRAPLLQALDVEFTKASEQMDVNKQHQIGLKRQELRDVTIIPKSIKTIEQLRAYVPNAFKE